MGRPGRQKQLLAVAIGLGTALTWLCHQPAGRTSGFGRWQSRAHQCSIQRSTAGPGSDSQTSPCHVVRLEQNLEGLLSVRFLAEGSGPQLGAQHLLFAGALDTGQRPMHCHPDGRCMPHWPTRVVVASIAAASFDGRGLATTVPLTLLARGGCEVNRSVVRCEARNDAGERWSAQAQL
jgi:hypothetical protein